MVIPGTLWAPSTVTVVVSMKQCNEIMMKPQRKSTYHRGDVKHHVSGQHCAAEIYSIPAYISLSNSQVAINLSFGDLHSGVCVFFFCPW